MSTDPQTPLTQLYLEKRLDLVRFFTARTGSPASAEDVVQELFFKIQNVDESEIRNGLAYLYRLGLNVMIDRLRSEVKAREREREYVSAHGGASSMDNAPPSAERAVIAREETRAVLAAIEGLPAQCRRVFRMHRFGGLSQVEIARQLGISQRGVEKHISNALRRLAEAQK